MHVEIKLRRRHPAKVMRLGRHKVTPSFQKLDLNDKELKSLKEGKEAEHWFITKEEFSKKKGKKVDKKEPKKDILS